MKAVADAVAAGWSADVAEPQVPASPATLWWCHAVLQCNVPSWEYGKPLKEPELANRVLDFTRYFSRDSKCEGNDYHIWIAPLAGAAGCSRPPARATLIFAPPRGRISHCVAGHVRFELRNVVANYPFENSRRFAGNQPKFWPRRPFAFELQCRGYAARTGGQHPAPSIAQFALDFPRKESVCGDHGH
jgi:hypothetical protein